MAAEEPPRRRQRTISIDDILADDPRLESYPDKLRNIFYDHGAFTEQALRAVCE